MKMTARIYAGFSILIEIIKHSCRSSLRPSATISCYIKSFTIRSYNFCTAFPQNLWKTPGRHCAGKAFCLFFCLILLSSCTYFKWTNLPWTKKDEIKKADFRTLENAVISMKEEEVRKRLGEPDVVSLMPDNRILWTYRPPLKVMPNNTDTVYLEFENGRVVKMVKAR
jgi:hypothetical protein